MRTTCLLLALFLISFSVKAQMQSLEVSAPGSTLGNYGSVRYNDPGQLGQKKATSLAYSDIEGTPFWNEKWSPAFLFLSGGNILKLKNVKLNLYTSDIVYMDDNGMELEAVGGIIKKIMFMSEKDTMKVLAQFAAFPDSKVANGYSYYRILADGKWKLLELKKSLIRTAEMTNIGGKKTESRFYTTSSYAIAAEEDLSTVRSLSYSNITAIIHPDAAAEQWLKDNKNSLKKESDVVSFLNYCNYKKM